MRSNVLKFGTVYEHDQQATLFEWAARLTPLYPELALLHAIPNGGWRSKATAMRLQREGVKSGIPDACLPVARHGFHGLYIELKVGKNRPSPTQLQWLEALHKQGYQAVVCYGWVEASEVIKDYLGMEMG